MFQSAMSYYDGCLVSCQFSALCLPLLKFNRVVWNTVGNRRTCVLKCLEVLYMGGGNAVSYISYHIISYHIISYHIISYHIISYHIISYIFYAAYPITVFLTTILPRRSISWLCACRNIISLCKVHDFSRYFTLHFSWRK